MKKPLLFTDGSLDPRTGIGYGAYLWVPDPERPMSELKTDIQLKCFVQTTSTQLELQTVLWALEEIPRPADGIIVYTDSQNIVGLPARRQRLEARGYRTNKGQLHILHEWYQAFFRLTDQMDCTFVKVSGHQPAGGKNRVDRMFELVDRASRKALRTMGDDLATFP